MVNGLFNYIITESHLRTVSVRMFLEFIRTIPETSNSAMCCMQIIS